MGNKQSAPAPQSLKSLLTPQPSNTSPTSSAGTAPTSSAGTTPDSFCPPGTPFFKGNPSDPPGVYCVMPSNFGQVSNYSGEVGHREVGYYLLLILIIWALLTILHSKIKIFK